MCGQNLLPYIHTYTAFVEQIAKYIRHSNMVQILQSDCLSNVLVVYCPACGRLRTSTGSVVMTRSTCATSLPLLASTKRPGRETALVSSSVAFAVDRHGNTDMSSCSLRLSHVHSDTSTPTYGVVCTLLAAALAAGIWEVKSSCTQPTRLQARSKAVCMAAMYTRESALNVTVPQFVGVECDLSVVIKVLCTLDAFTKRNLLVDYKCCTYRLVVFG